MVTPYIVCSDSMVFLECVIRMNCVSSDTRTTRSYSSSRQCGPTTKRVRKESDGRFRLGQSWHDCSLTAIFEALKTAVEDVETLHALLTPAEKASRVFKFQANDRTFLAFSEGDGDEARHIVRF